MDPNLCLLWMKSLILFRLIRNYLQAYSYSLEMWFLFRLRILRLVLILTYSYNKLNSKWIFCLVFFSKQIFSFRVIFHQRRILLCHPTSSLIQQQQMELTELQRLVRRETREDLQQYKEQRTEETIEETCFIRKMKKWNVQQQKFYIIADW